jgi:hypothetical protein
VFNACNSFSFAITEGLGLQKPSPDYFNQSFPAFYPGIWRECHQIITS